MTLDDIEADDFFIIMMNAIIEPITFELAQQEASADFRTDSQQVTWNEFAGNYN